MEARRGLDDPQAGLFGMLLHCLERLLLLFLGRLLDRLPAGRIVLALESGRDRGARLPNEPVDVVAEPPAPACRELQHPGLTGLVEVVDVAPVRRGRLARGLGPQELTEKAVTSGPGRPEDEEVEALDLDSGPEFDRLDRSGLAQHSIEGLQVRGRLEGEGARVTRTVQLVRGERFGNLHGLFPRSHTS